MSCENNIKHMIERVMIRTEENRTEQENHAEQSSYDYLLLNSFLCVTHLWSIVDIQSDHYSG